MSLPYSPHLSPHPPGVEQPTALHRFSSLPQTLPPRSHVDGGAGSPKLFSLDTVYFQRMATGAWPSSWRNWRSGMQPSSTRPSTRTGSCFPRIFDMATAMATRMAMRTGSCPPKSFAHGGPSHAPLSSYTSAHLSSHPPRMEQCTLRFARH